MKLKCREILVSPLQGAPRVDNMVRKEEDNKAHMVAHNSQDSPMAVQLLLEDDLHKQ